jgi:hypothetical protein
MDRIRVGGVDVRPAAVGRRAGHGAKQLESVLGKPLWQMQMRLGPGDDVHFPQRLHG